ncbi:endopeptidase La [Candidatus Babeliales bacterium]|nr:endopeptidase La [Candidatus Babeliales bacterium]
MKELNNKNNVEEIPTQLPVIPTMDVVVFPHMVVPLLVLDEQIIKGIEAALEGSKKILLLATKEQPDGITGPIGVEDLYSVGTVGNIMRVMRLPEGGVKLLVQGLMRASVEDILSDNDILQVQLTPISFEEENSEEIEAKVGELTSLIESMSASGRVFGPDAQIILSQIKDPEKIADFILSHLSLSVSQAQALLEKNIISELLDGIYKELDAEVEVSKVQEKVMSNARDSINKSQREYYLREQLKAIRKELGDDNDTEVEELRNKLETLKLSEEASTEATKQLNRLEKIPADSMEYTVIRNYLDWIISLPWGVYTKDNLEIKDAKENLDNDHFGLKEIKDRILDYLSVRKLKENNCHTPILCFVGPPGVGKTSLGQSIAKSMGRNFFRISLGGVHDESEIRGHRRTYVGAMPGRFIQAIRKTESCNPLIMIDEIDKVGKDQRGDPASALLEVLDPEQNKNFYDNYLGLGFDLSKVMFIATANDLTTIPEPLRDRMELIELSGYTYDEKLEIAKRHLITKAIKNYGLEKKNFKLSDKVVDSIINKYTRESGVRQLERQIQKLCSKYVRSIVEEDKEVSFSSTNLKNYLGNSPMNYTNFHKDRIGVSNGLAWTPYGGEVLQVEAMLMPGNGKLILTGQLGDVMKESAQAAVSYARAHSEKFGIPKELFTTYDLHIHLPAGAIPKDGPSAGITLLSSVLSVLTKRPVNSKFAMTGELNLQGEVLPIGGLKEKILAAKQEGLEQIIIPKLNEQDLELITEISKGMKIHLVENVSEVIDKVLTINSKD